MKLNRLLTASLLGFSLMLTTSSALACDHSSGESQESHWSFFGWCHHTDNDSHRECDHDGQNTGTGKNCDRGKGNNGGYCSTGGSTSGSGSTGSGSAAGSGKGVSQ